MNSVTLASLEDPREQYKTMHLGLNEINDFECFQNVHTDPAAAQEPAWSWFFVEC